METRTFLSGAMAAILVAAIAGPALAGDKRSGPMRLLDGTFDVVPGTLVRVNATGARAHINVRTEGLTPGNAYTLWSISFSDTVNCDFGDAALGTLCGIGDDDAADTGFAISQVAGHIVGSSGKGNFGGTVDVVDAADAEFHIVVADHGPKDPAQLPGQIKTPGPGVQIGFIVP